jgi:hypothetical protein
LVSAHSSQLEMTSRFRRAVDKVHRSARVSRVERFQGGGWGGGGGRGPNTVAEHQSDARLAVVSEAFFVFFRPTFSIKKMEK